MSWNAESGHLPMEKSASNACFGCGPANACGLQLEFYSREDRPGHVFCEAAIPKTFEGPPGHVHGGVIATILDEAMGKANKPNGIVAMTRTMDIQFLRPVPLNVPLVIEGWNERRDGRKNFNAGSIRSAAGDVLATATGLFIELSAEMVQRALQKRADGDAGIP